MRNDSASYQIFGVSIAATRQLVVHWEWIESCDRTQFFIADLTARVQDFDQLKFTRRLLVPAEQFRDRSGFSKPRGWSGRQSAVPMWCTTDYVLHC